MKICFHNHACNTQGSPAAPTIERVAVTLKIIKHKDNKNAREIALSFVPMVYFDGTTRNRSEITAHHSWGS